MKRNTQLVEHAIKALNEKWTYVYGAYGHLAVESNLNKLLEWNPDDIGTTQIQRAREAIERSKNQTKIERFVDCYGLVKSLLWWEGEYDDPTIKGLYPERNTLTACSQAYVKGSISHFPDVPGVILYRTGHVAIYCGEGRVIDATPGWNGVVREYQITGDFEDGEVKNAVFDPNTGNVFTHWFYDTYISYPKDVVLDPIWGQQSYITGTGTAGATVTVKFGFETFTCTVQDDGYWMVRTLPTAMVGQRVLAIHQVDGKLPTYATREVLPRT